jgi:hypothetical protein
LYSITERNYTVVDQRGRDNPPIFYIDTQVANYRYHALLMLPVADKFDLLMDLNSQDQQVREVEGQFLVTRPRGLYGFTTIDARNKFCKRCNTLSEIDEEPICIPVTVPNLVTDEPFSKQISYQSGT